MPSNEEAADQTEADQTITVEDLLATNEDVNVEEASQEETAE